MTIQDWILLALIIVGLLGVGFYFLNKWSVKKMAEQQNFLKNNKQTVTIYVIDKKRDKVENANLSSTITSQFPKRYKYMKMYFVKAKIGPQITTLMCDKPVFEAIPVKKSVKVELAGMYIVSIPGMKSKEELKQIKAKQKKAEKEQKKNKQ